MGTNDYLNELNGFSLDAPPPVDRGPLLGFEDPDPVPAEDSNEPFSPEKPRHPVDTSPQGVYIDTVNEAIQGLDPASRNMLAIEMFMAMPGVYGSDIGNVFDEQGELDGYAFDRAVNSTVNLAVEFGPDKYGSGTDTNSEYLQILLGDTERDAGELKKAFQAKLDEIEKQKASGGGGRVINYIDPVALAQSAKQAFASTTGRSATAAEQQAFVKQIHSLQASGATGIQVGARAESFAQSQAPVEAGAMEYSNAAQALMKAMGM